MEIEPASLETLVYGDNALAQDPEWHNHPFPFNGAKQLRQVSWRGTDIESLSQALPNCPNVTALNFTLSTDYGSWTFEKLQAWPTFTTLRRLELDCLRVGDDIGWSCFLLPFARFSRQVPDLSAALNIVGCAANRRGLASLLYSN